jgi:hypothetical protein
MTDPKPKASRKAATPEPGPKQRSWIGEWMRSKDFWRDVASRAVAGLIVVAVSALVTASVAWILSPSVGPTLVWIGAGALVFIVVIGTGLTAIRLWYSFIMKYAPRFRKRGTALNLLVFVGPLLLIFVGIIALATVVLNASLPWLDSLQP